MKELLFALVGAVICSPFIAAVIAIGRADEVTINKSVLYVAGGILFVLLGVGARFWGDAIGRIISAVLNGLAAHRQAQFPAPNKIDARTQIVNMKHHALVDENGEQVELPQGTRVIEVLR